MKPKSKRCGLQFAQAFSSSWTQILLKDNVLPSKAQTQLMTPCKDKDKNRSGEAAVFSKYMCGKNIKEMLQLAATSLLLLRDVMWSYNVAWGESPKVPASITHTHTEDATETWCCGLRGALKAVHIKESTVCKEGSWHICLCMWVELGIGLGFKFCWWYYQQIYIFHSHVCEYMFIASEKEI